MADRDFYEKYGKMEADDIIKNPDFVAFIIGKQSEYRQEFIFNSADNLRLVK